MKMMRYTIERELALAGDAKHPLSSRRRRHELRVSPPRIVRVSPDEWRFLLGEGEGEENSDSDVCMNRSIKTQKRATMATLSVESKTPRSSFADNTPHLVVFSGGTAFNSIAKVLGEKLSTRVTYVLPVSATPDLSWRYWGE